MRSAAPANLAPDPNPDPVPDPTALYRHAAVLGAACSSPKRLQLLMLLAQAPKTVGQLAGQIGQSVAAASAHLQALKRAGLVAADREGQQVRYRLAHREAYTLLGALMEAGVHVLPAAEQVARAHLHDADTRAEISMADLHADLVAGRVTVIDLRPEDEYAAGHLPRARSIPHVRLADRLSDVPRRRRVVAYCRGPYCLSALGALRTARDAGRRIGRLPYGVNEWRAEGLPLETGDEL